MKKGSRAVGKATRYQVRGHRNVERIVAAVEESGGAVLSRPDPTSAPYEMTVRTPQGEDIELVCYAFTASKSSQRGRPEDAHRFQIKYGSDRPRYHRLSFDPSGRRVTLFFGVHHELKLFVAVDPAKHDPTWFPSIIEVSAGDLDEATRTGWYGWERDPGEPSETEERHLLSFEIEAVCAFRPEHFLRYVAFERMARGLDPGERLLLVDRIARNLPQRSNSIQDRSLHPMER